MTKWTTLLMGALFLAGLGVTAAAAEPAGSQGQPAAQAPATDASQPAGEPSQAQPGEATKPDQAVGTVDKPSEKARMAFNPGSVARAVVTTGVKDREPVDHVDVVNNTIDRVVFFTELRDMAGQRVVHRWMHDGKVMAKVAFDVGGPRWRVWSSKHLEPDWLGTWTVQVVNVAGDVVDSKSFTYAQAPESKGGQ